MDYHRLPENQSNPTPLISTPLIIKADPIDFFCVAYILAPMPFGQD